MQKPIIWHSSRQEERWPNKLLFKSACFASMWRHVNWLHGVSIGLDMFGFPWTFRHSDREQILNVISQIDGFRVIRRTGMWIQVKLLTELRVKPLEGDFCWPSKCGNQRRNDEASRSRWWKPRDWESSSTALVWCCKKSQKKAANDTWWVVPFPKERHKYNQM